MTKPKETKVTASAPAGEPINVLTGEAAAATAPSVAPPASASVPTIDYDAIADKVSAKITPVLESLKSATKAADDLLAPPAPPVAPAPKDEPKKVERDLFGFEMH